MATLTELTDDEISKKYEFTTINDSIIEKDWAAGSRDPITQTDFTAEYSAGKPIGAYGEVKYSPALWKIIDETLVNAIDHKIRCEKNAAPASRVTYIRVEIEKSGWIRVKNDGPGVETAIHKVASAKLGKETRVPTFIFGTLFQGSNRKPAPDSIIGGTNGLGAKLGIIFATESSVETVSNTDYFLQRWHDHMKICDDPIVIPLSNPKVKQLGDRARPHTTISFLPDYKLFGYEKFDDDAYALLCRLIRARVIFASVYAQIPVWFNNEKYTCAPSDLARIFFPGLPTFTTSVTPEANPKAPHHNHAWDICAVIGPAGCAGNANGVMVRDGKHYTYIKERLTADVRAEVAKMLKDKDAVVGPSVINNNVFLFVNAKIPGVHWTGQRKDVLDIEKTKLTGYSLPPKFAIDIATVLKTQLIASAAKKNKKSNKFDYDKIRPARFAGKKNKAPFLLLAEGDSAFTQIVIGASKHLGWDNYGIMCMGGVIINIRKECTITRVNGIKYVKMSKKMSENLFWNAFLAEMGLNVKYDYDPKSSTYEKEMSELRYRSGIIGCVDQDFDGKGKILSLLISAYEYLWPNLIKQGHIHWWCSPIIRAYPKNGGKVLEFYSIREFETWAELHVGYQSKYDIKYYKGLATHSRDETIQMFANFKDHLYKYNLDDNSAELFNVYFGRLPDLRKTQLSKTAPIPTEAELDMIEKTKTITCSHHLLHEADPFQRDDIERKLAEVYDGFNQSGRKITNGILGGKMTKGKPIKVNQLAGFISEHGNYHHGEVGLGDSIAGRAFVTTGGRQIPLLVPLSQFGSRLGGGDDRGATRYIFCKLNKPITDTLFPAADYGLLDFHFDEGKRCEPVYFLPIIPLCVLESAVLPSHGWKFQTWARDVYSIIDATRLMIKFGRDVNIATPPPATYAGTPYEWKGEFRNIAGKQYSMGKYVYVSATNTLTITELPLRVWTNNYVVDLKKLAARDDRIIHNVDDFSDDLTVRIVVKLKPGAIDLLETMGKASIDGVEEYFSLRNYMETHLNFTVDNRVVSFTNYMSAVRLWFDKRKDHYAKRVARDSILLELDILRLSEIIKYVRTGYKFSGLKEAEMVARLVADGFVTLEVTRINDPGFVAADKIRDRILHGPESSYKYLLNMGDLRKSSEALAEYEAELVKARAKYIDYILESSSGSFPGAAIWMRELAALEANLREGMRTFWKYGDYAKFKYD